MRLVQWNPDGSSECGRFKVTRYKYTEQSLPRWCLWGKVIHCLPGGPVESYCLSLTGPVTKGKIKAALKKHRNYEVKVMG